MSSAIITGRIQEWQYLPLEALRKVGLWIIFSQAWLRSCHSPLHSMFPHHITVVLCLGQLYTAELEQAELIHLYKTFGSSNDFQKQSSEQAEKEIKALGCTPYQCGGLLSSTTTLFSKLSAMTIQEIHPKALVCQSS